MQTVEEETNPGLIVEDEKGVKNTANYKFKSVTSFSFVKLIRSLASPKDTSARKEAKFELDLCKASAKQLNIQSKGAVIPTNVLTSYFYELEMGALPHPSFMSLLKKGSVLMLLSTELTDLVGNIDIPKETTTPSEYWIGKDENVIKQDIDFDIITLSPKSVVTSIVITPKILNQSSTYIEIFLRQSLANALGQAIDKAGFYGNGTNGVPMGIKNTAGIKTVKFTAEDPSFQELVAMETAIALESSNVENTAFVMNPSFRGHSKMNLKFPTDSAKGGIIWEKGQTINDYQAQVTNQINKGDIFFGNFSDFLLHRPLNKFD